jgi:hypothetical protein
LIAFSTYLRTIKAQQEPQQQGHQQQESPLRRLEPPRHLPGLPHQLGPRRPPELQAAAYLRPVN